MVGSACLRILKASGYTNIITKNSKELDLRNQNQVSKFIKTVNPDVIINSAAKVGGILANDSYPYEFLMDNMLIQNNLISAAHELNVSKFIFLGSSCIYPKFSDQPISEESLLTKSLEPTNQWYAIAKISGVKLIEALNKQYGRNYVALMPTNLYGPGDNFDLISSHVLPAMIRKFHESKINGNTDVTLWGSGSPKREFLHTEDLGKSIKFVLENQLSHDIYNVGVGNDIEIKELALLIQKIVGHEGNILWDTSKPDGTPRKLLDISKMTDLGWQPEIGLLDGITDTYNWFLDNYNFIKERN